MRAREISSDVEFEQTFRTHYSSVLAYVRRRAPAPIVDDAVAETFLVAWRRRDRMPAEALPWLYAVARRVLSTQARSERRRQLLRGRLAGEPEPAVAETDEAPPIIAALNALGPKDREALILVAWEGLTPTEAAVAVGQSPGAFRVRLHRARRRLESQLEPPIPGKPSHEMTP